jgi:hypothetical protein
MKVGQKVQAKIKNRWTNVVVKKINKTGIRITQPNGVDISLLAELVRELPKTAGVKRGANHKVTTNTKTTTKPRKTTPKVDKKEVVVSRPGTKKNPWIPLSDLRSQSAISDLDYKTKAKFDSIIKNLIDVYGYKGT